MERTWNSGITGMGVNVAVVGEGMELLHEDLAANVNTSLSYNYTENGDESGFAGTRVAGVIAAVGDNGLGVRGVAPRAGIYGYNLSGGLREADIIDAGISDADVTDANVKDAMLRNRVITAVSFNDWGGEDVPVLQGASSAWEEGVELGISEGFYGKGTFYVFGAGDGHENKDQGNFDEYSGYYAVTATCSVDSSGRKSTFSEEGVNLWVCAPGSDILTTGSNDGYVTVSGTSYSAAQVSGVAALMREVNGKLSWRDIKLILAASARQNDPSDPGWETGAVKYDPDTGYGFDGSDTGHDLDTGLGSDTEYKYNTKYGFGVVDAAAAVKLAENWRRVGPMTTLTASSDSEIPLSDHDGEADGVITSTLTIPDTEELSFTEFVEVQLTFSHDHLPDLNIQLISPSGTVSQLVTDFSGETEGNGMEDVDFSYSEHTHRFGSAKHLGEHPAGEWTLKISDTATSASSATGATSVNGDTGTLHSWSIKVYGHKTDNAVTDSGKEIVPKHHDVTFGGQTVDNQVYTMGSRITRLNLPNATGGKKPYRYSSSPTFLPSGLSWSTAGSGSASIIGRPNAVTPETTYTYTVEDANGDTDEITFTITVQRLNNSIPDFGNAIINDKHYITGVQISPLVLPSATGGDGSRRYSLTPSSLPAGLTYDGISRRISGTPRVSLSETDYTWTVTDDDGDTDSISFSITIRSQSNIPSFGNKTVDDKVYLTGETVNLTLPEATGGATPRRYSLTPPTLPAGLAFNSGTRVISGTPTTPTPEKTYTYTVRDDDSDTDEADTDSLTFSITIERDSQPSLVTVGNKIYIEGETTNLPVTLPAATGGNAPLTYSLTPALPDGLNFNSNTRVISGTPTAVTTNTDYTYRVIDNDGDAVQRTFRIRVQADIPPDFDGATVNDKIYFTGETVSLTLPIGRRGNLAVFTSLIYTLTPALPSGLSFNSLSRRITGTSTAPTPETAYVYTVEDEDGDTATLSFNITVRAEPDTSPTFGSETIDDQRYLTGETVSVTLPEATSGNAPLTYSLNNSVTNFLTLPAALNFDANTRTIAGTVDLTIDPSNFGNPFIYTYTVTDADGDTADLTFSITVEEDSMPEFEGTTVPDQMVYTAGRSLTLPAATSGNPPLTYSITPPLPAGLRFNSNTRTITGTPTRASSGTYTYTVTDRNGDTAETSFMLRVTDPPVRRPPSGTDAGGGGGCAVSDQKGGGADIFAVMASLMLIPISVAIRRKRRSYIKDKEII